MQISGMGHCWVPTDSALLGRWLWISFSRNVLYMPAADYLGIGGPNNTEVPPFFHGNHSVGRQKRLAAHSCPNTVLRCSWGICLSLGTVKRHFGVTGGSRKNSKHVFAESLAVVQQNPTFLRQV